MIALSTTTILLTLTLPALAYFLGRELFRIDTAGEHRKRNAIKASAMLTSLGCVKLPRALEAYAVSDWSGLATEIANLAELATDPKAIAAEFAQTFDRLLTAKLSTDEGKALLAAKLAEVNGTKLTT